MSRLISLSRNVLWQALEHDMVNTAKAVAYSAMLTVFPALLVLTTLFAQVEDGPTLIGEIRAVFEQVLPADTMDMLQSTVLTRRIHSIQVIFSATGLSLFASLGVTLSLMEGFRRAYRLPLAGWGFWSRRARALLLVPIALIPLAVATLLVVFGRDIEGWMVERANHELRHIVLFFWRMVRWTIALGTSVSVLTALYHFGTRRIESWHRVALGAAAASLLWFPTTLLFGWYVTRIADYTMFYGSFGAGIATLVWLYITAFSVLLGAEINGYFYCARQRQNALAEPVAALAEIKHRQ
jgi:membrane protein